MAWIKDTSRVLCEMCHEPGVQMGCIACKQVYYCSKACSIAHCAKHLGDCDPMGLVLPHSLGQQCDHCGRYGKVHKCKGCNVAFYCDRKCSQDAWAKHKAECKAIKNEDSTAVQREWWKEKRMGMDLLYAATTTMTSFDPQQNLIVMMLRRNLTGDPAKVGFTLIFSHIYTFGELYIKDMEISKVLDEHRARSAEACWMVAHFYTDAPTTESRFNTDIFSLSPQMVVSMQDDILRGVVSVDMFTKFLASK